MPAECELYDCGILATGRCQHCGRAYCGLHQDQSRPSDREFFGLPGNLCCECSGPYLRAQEDQKAARKKAEAEAKALAAQATHAARAVIARYQSDLLAALSAKGFPGSSRYTRQRRTLLGKVRSEKYGERHYGLYGDPVSVKAPVGNDRDCYEGKAWHSITTDGQVSSEPGAKPYDPVMGAMNLCRLAAMEGIRIPVPQELLDHPEWPPGLRFR